MVWSLQDSQGFESRKIAAFVVPYTRGQGLDIGCGMERCWPHMIGVDSAKAFGEQTNANITVDDATNLKLFGNESMDFVFSSHLLEHLEDTRKALTEWWRIIRPGGHLCLYLPHKDLYPNIGEEGANPDHKHDFLPDDIINHMKAVAADTGHGWALVENETRDGTNEYSMFLVFRKHEEEGAWWIEAPWQRNPEGKKRAVVIRFGAIGDQIQASSILPLLKEQGYHVTYMTTPAGQDVLLHNPYINEWWIQDKDQVPNVELGPYVETLRERFDNLINLSESVEVSLLALPDRTNGTWSHQARHKILGGVNYFERTHDIAGVPHRFAPRFHPTAEERAWAEQTKAEFDGPVVMWPVNGSSMHKTYPHTDVVVKWTLDQTDVHFVLTCTPADKLLPMGFCESVKKHGGDVGRIRIIAGEWTLRQCLTFAEYADVVVGPETGVLNAVSHLNVPKVVMLSHSSRDNLTKHWRKTITLEPVDTPCFPCHRLHYTWDNCVRVEETAAALCATNIHPKRVVQAIMRSLPQTKRGRKNLAMAAD